MMADEYIKSKMELKSMAVYWEEVLKRDDIKTSDEILISEIKNVLNMIGPRGIIFLFIEAIKAMENKNKRTRYDDGFRDAKEEFGGGVD